MCENHRGLVERVAAMAEETRVRATWREQDGRPLQLTDPAALESTDD